MKLAKYLALFKISFQQEFIYRLNFIMWRLRNVVQIFLVFFLWSTIFSDPTRQIFGYDKGKILTYVFGILILKAIVFSSRTIDIAGEISRGDLTNYLLKPINYFRYWFTRDLSSKGLNLIFAFFETLILFLILKPPFYWQASPLILLVFFLSVIVAVILFFELLLIVNMVPFWAPESGWGAQFLFMGIIVEFLSGAIFPIDVLPELIQKILHFLPFSYLLFFPLQVYLGKINLNLIFSGVVISFFWLIALSFIVRFIWNKGLKKYAAEGR